MFIGLFPVNVEPCGVDGEVHLVLGDFRGLIVVQRVAVFVPGACVEADESLLVLLLIILHICIIAIKSQKLLNKKLTEHDLDKYISKWLEDLTNQGS
jgi:hypothetical protein